MAGELKDALGKLYASIVMFPDLDPLLRPIILDLEKLESSRAIDERPAIDGEASKVFQA